MGWAWWLIQSTLGPKFSYLTLSRSKFDKSNNIWICDKSENAGNVWWMLTVVAVSFRYRIITLTLLLIRVIDGDYQSLAKITRRKENHFNSEQYIKYIAEYYHLWDTLKPMLRTIAEHKIHCQHHHQLATLTWLLFSLS